MIRSEDSWTSLSRQTAVLAIEGTKDGGELIVIPHIPRAVDCPIERCIGLGVVSSVTPGDVARICNVRA
jgi:hypothetical protein